MSSILTKTNAGRVFWGILLCVLTGFLGCSSSLSSMTIEIGNRMYPAFHDTTTTKLHEKVSIGDSEYSFKTIAFYPHFAIIDSMRKAVSLSDEPVNPAFKIRVFKDHKVVDETWAFFGPGAPHFARNSFLTFRVMRFTYRGKVYDSNKEGREDEERK